MTAMGWIFILLSWGFIIGLAGFCFHRIFSQPAESQSKEQK